jgi:hypothetical protein
MRERPAVDPVKDAVLRQWAYGVGRRAGGIRELELSGGRFRRLAVRDHEERVIELSAL